MGSQSQGKTLERFRAASAASAAALVLLGFATAAASRAGITHGPLAISYQTGAAFCLAGIGLLCLQEGRSRSPRFRLLGRTCGVAVLAIGGLVLVGRLALLLPGGTPGASPRVPLPGFQSPLGVTAPATAFGFVLIGLSILLLDARHIQARRAFQILVSLLGLMALSALVGYLYLAVHLNDLVPSAAPMSLTSAIGGFLTFVSLWLARPEVGLPAILAGDSPDGVGHADIIGLLSRLVAGDAAYFRGRAAPRTHAAAVCWMVARANDTIGPHRDLTGTELMEPFGGGTPSQRVNRFLQILGVAPRPPGEFTMEAPDLLVGEFRRELVAQRDLVLS